MPPYIGFLNIIAACVPHFVFSGTISETGKSKIFSGRINKKPVVVKLLSVKDAYWRAKFANEIKVYRNFSRHDAPVKTAKVIYTNISKGIIVYEQLMGQPLSGARYPTEPAQFAYCPRLVAAIEKISEYSHLPIQRETCSNIFRLRKASSYASLDILSSDDLAKIKQLSAISGGAVTFAHGDLLLGNCLLLDRDDSLVCLDWEFAGHYLKGFDLALLWIIMMKSSASRKYILDHVFAKDKKFPCEFFINLFLLIAREIKIHREAGFVPGVRHVLNGLYADLQWLRAVTRGCRRARTCPPY